MTIRQKDIVHSFEKTCMGVGISPELHADALKIFYQFTRLEMFRPVEEHVLQKVGQALLAICLVGGTRLNIQVHTHPVLGVLVLHQHIPESVVEPAENHFRVQWQITFFMRPGRLW